MRKVYQCSGCGGLFQTEEKALACEEQHRDFKDFEIIGARYTECGKQGGMSMAFSSIPSQPTVPKTIKVKFSKDYDDVGLYKLLQYNPK